jgi:hypothetical protein
MSKDIDPQQVVLDSWFVVSLESPRVYKRDPQTVQVIGGLSTGNSRIICLGRESEGLTSVIVGDIDNDQAVIFRGLGTPDYDAMISKGVDLSLANQNSVIATSTSHLREQLGAI